MPEHKHDAELVISYFMLNRSNFFCSTITGGQFNYTAEVDFPKTGENVKITMIFKGLDAFDNLRASVEVICKFTIVSLKVPILYNRLCKTLRLFKM